MRRTIFSPDFLESAQRCAFFDKAERNENGAPTVQDAVAIAGTMDVTSESPEVTYAQQYIALLRDRLIGETVEYQVPMWVRPTCDAIADVAIVTDDHAHILKWVVGWYGQDAPIENSLECQALAVGGLNLSDGVQNVTVHRVYVTQERYEQVSYCTRDTAPIQRRLAEATALYVRGEKIAAGSHCRQCTNAVSCPAIRRDLEQLDIHKNVDLLTVTEIEDAYEHATVIGNWIKTVERNLTKIADAGQSAKWTMKPSRSIRKWDKEKHADMACELSLHLGKRIETHSQVLLSAAELEKLYGKSKDVAAIIKTAVVYNDGKPKLARKTGVK